MTTNDATPRETLSVTFACGSQEYWDLEPDGSIHLDIRQDQAVVSSDHLSEPDADVVERAAKALADLAGVEGWNWYTDEDGEAQFPGWDDLSDDDEYMGYEAEWPNHGRNHYRKQARAALAAIAPKEPRHE